MLKWIAKVLAGLFLLLIAISITLFAGYKIETRNHVSRFEAAFKDGKVFPYLVREKDGSLYSGKVYGTFFGDRLFDSKEWEGTYKQGKPSGEFRIYSPEGHIKSVWVYENGKFNRRS